MAIEKLTQKQKPSFEKFLYLYDLSLIFLYDLIVVVVVALLSPTPADQTILKIDFSMDLDIPRPFFNRWNNTLRKNPQLIIY